MFVKKNCKSVNQSQSSVWDCAEKKFTGPVRLKPADQPEHVRLPLLVYPVTGKCVFRNGTDRHTDGQHDSMTELAGKYGSMKQKVTFQLLSDIFGMLSSQSVKLTFFAVSA